MEQHKTILLLGAGSDIAKAVARKFAALGYAVQLAGRKEEQLARLQKDLIGRYGADTAVYHFDAVDFESHGRLVAHLNPFPDVAVYSAGTMYDQEEAGESWDKARNMIEVNYAGAVSVLNRLATAMKRRGHGCIVGISSVAGERGRGSNYIYGSTKAAFTAYLSGLRSELFKKGVQVITVKPGFVYTKMTREMALPARLTARPEKVADAIYQAVEKKKDTVYVKPVWRGIMQVIRLLPEPVFKRTKL